MRAYHELIHGYIYLNINEYMNLDMYMYICIVCIQYTNISLHVHVITELQWDFSTWINHP